MSDVPREEFKGTNRFSILRRLGAGAFGAVYSAYDRERDRIVALKVLRQKDPSALYYFKNEFRTLSGVIHPNLVTLYNLMSDGEDWFFTMELVKGVDFLSYVRGRGRQTQTATDPANVSTVPSFVYDETKDEDQAPTLRPKDLDNFRQGDLHSLLAISIENLDRLRASLVQLGRGICAIHAAGKLHRDLKPSNVLVTDSGRVVILDFGLITDLTPNSYESTQLAGTPNYMSPEQAAGLAVAEASDWYEVGVILYEALTGNVPFHGRARDILRAKQWQEPRAPCDLVSSIPEDLSTLCSDLLRLDPRKRPTGSEFIRRLKHDESDSITNIQVSTSSIERVPFVGRARQLSELNDALHATKNGQPVIALVHGISGIGKSTLVRHFVESLEKDDPKIVVLTGRCYEQESVPYKAFDSLVDALSRYLGSLPILEAESVIPRDVQALARLFPVLRQVEAVVRAKWRTLDGIDLQELRRRGFSALRELLSRLGDRKQLVLFIDDLQWGDTDSAALLSEILRAPDAPALLLIGSYRSDDVETSSMLKTFLPSLRATSANDVRELRIEELDDSESFNLALALMNPQFTLTSDHALTIARESGGSPLFINELSHYLRVTSAALTNGTTDTRSSKKKEVTLEEVIDARYRQLPESARRLLEIVAVAGKPVERSVASRAASLDKEEESLILLRSNYLVRTRELQDRQEIETYHDRIRETLNAHLSPEKLKEHHHRLALALELSKQSDSETIAVHYQGAGDYERAADYAVKAAEQASSAFAFDRAARLYQLAIELRPQSIGRPLRIRLGEALANAGRGAEAANVYLAALDGAKAAEIQELRRRAAEQLLRSGHIDQGLSVLRTVLSSMGLKLPESPRQALISFLGQRALARLRGLNFHERDQSQISPQQIARIDTCWSVAVGLSMVDVIRGAEFQARHLLLALRAGEPSRVVRALTTEAAYTSVGGSRSQQRTQRLLKKAKELAKQLDEPDAFGRVLLASGISAYLNGEWKKAVNSCEEAERILREQCTGVTWERHTACHFSLMSLVNLGEWQQVKRRLPNLLKEAKQQGDLLAETNLSIRMSYILLLAANELDKAQDELREGMRAWSQQGFHTQHYYDLIRRTEIALYSGYGIDAWKFITRSWSALEGSLILRIQTFRIESQFLLARSALAAAVQSDTSLPHRLISPRDLLRAAARASRKLQREGTSYANALCLLSRACLAAIGRRETEAVTLLSQAEAEFVAIDMALYAAATRWRRGEIIGGDEGGSIIASADKWMRDQKIEQPVRIVEMLSPGLSK
jgi:eukaryotic-like serine/threonine-protein kinase